jgi:hypothetical protein
MVYMYAENDIHSMIQLTFIHNTPTRTIHKQNTKHKSVKGNKYAHVTAASFSRFTHTKVTKLKSDIHTRSCACVNVNTTLTRDATTGATTLLLPVISNTLRHTLRHTGTP